MEIEQSTEDTSANLEARVLPFSDSRKHIFIKDLRPKDVIRCSFLVKYKELAFSKNGKAFLAMTLSDSTGEVDTRVWEGAEEMSAQFQEGDVVAVAGRVQFFQNRLQMIVQHMALVAKEEVRLEDYIPSSQQNLNLLYEEMVTIFREMKNPWIRELGLSLLTDPDISLRYKICPAAKTIHHAFIGGLLCHSLQLIKIVQKIIPLYEGIDEEILIFGAAFHDFGKIFELSYQGNFGYTHEGQLVGHIVIGATLVDRKIQNIPNFPKELEWQLKHLILSHHGKIEYGSPKKPATLEAQFIHHLDDMDSKINSIQTFMKSENNSSRWTAYHKAYDQYYYKPDCYLTDPEF